MSLNHIRNFCIVAHIDHGKSTLADRLIEFTSTVSKREMKDQLLDSMDLEKERGITIKAQAVRMNYTAKDGQEYCLNLIDTPGHVDFSYEVSRSIAACEGALLVVDATQGVEAQTMANATLAIAHDLEIIPVINKIDLPSSDPDKVKEEIENLIGVDCSNALLVSAKEGTGVPELLEAIVERIPAPKGEEENPLRALVFDAVYDSYKGVIVYCRIVDGALKVGDRIKFKETDTPFEVIEAGVFTPKMQLTTGLETGKVGFFNATIKEMSQVNIGDTVVLEKFKDVPAIPGFQKAKQMVFCGLYPVETNAFNDLRTALEKLTLNDSSLSYFPENSLALGFGFRCGFLGLLHMEIIQERLEREYDLDLVTTAPNVVYEVKMVDGTILEIDSPSKLPDLTKIEEIREPFVHATIFMPKEFIGTIMELAKERRGVMDTMEFISENRVSISFDLPLSETTRCRCPRVYSTSTINSRAELEVMLLSTTKILATELQTFPVLKFLLTVTRLTLSHSFAIKTKLNTAVEMLLPNFASSYRDISSRFHSRLQLAQRLLPVKILLLLEKTFWPSVTAVTLLVNVSFLKNKKKVRSA